MASITKRGKYWRAQVRRRGYPTQFRTFDTKALAEAWARQLESEMDRGVFKSREEAERTTFAEALERYWNEVASKKRFPKLERYRINRWLRHSLSSYFLANLRGAAIERKCESYLQAPVALPKFSAEQRLDMFARAVEPTLQRELKHKGAATGDGSYSAELIGYVEVVGRQM